MPMKIVMSKGELELFTCFLSASSSYFEYGMGGSTCLAAKTVKDVVSAVDSDPVWVKKVESEIAVGSTVNQLQLNHVDIGPTGSWGHPLKKGLPQHDAYSRAITQTGIPTFDLCLVDGRFRVACFLQALQYLQADAVIGIHDYKSRSEYHIVEEFARPICNCEQLFFFVRRYDVDWLKLADALETYRRNPA